MSRSNLAVAADYADAMLVARFWKNLLFLALFLLLLIQIAVFFIDDNLDWNVGKFASQL